MLIEGSRESGQDDFNQLLGHVATPKGSEGKRFGNPEWTSLEKILPCNCTLRKKSDIVKRKFSPKQGGFFRTWNSGGDLVLGAMLKLCGSGSMRESKELAGLVAIVPGRENSATTRHITTQRN
jgi:hypothetical protein